MNTQDLEYMEHALSLAHRAAEMGEVPVGAVLVKEGEIIGEGWNQPIKLNDPTAHAEIMAIRAAGLALDNYRLLDTSLYVTLEPCSMCVGSMIHARIKRLVFGAADPRTGAVSSALNLLSEPCHNHKIEVLGGVLQNECSAVLQNFFRLKRNT